MNELLNLPGPWFIAAYVALGIVALMTRPLFRRLCRAGGTTASGAGTDLTVYQMAYLAGGARRACETALTSLAQSESIQPNPGRRGFLAGKPRTVGASDIDKAVLDSVRRGGDAVPSGGAGEAVLQRCAEILSARGLLHAPGSAFLRCQRLAANAPLFALAAVGVAKIGLGIQRDRPVTILVLLVLATVAFMWFAKGPAAARTALGNKTLDVLHKRNAALKSTVLKRVADVTGADLSLAVALFGISVLSGGPYAWVMHALAPPPTDSGSSSSSDDSGYGSSSSSSSSSCSSGSSCGGGSGCGGCGS